MVSCYEKKLVKYVYVFTKNGSFMEFGNLFYIPNTVFVTCGICSFQSTMVTDFKNPREENGVSFKFI